MSWGDIIMLIGAGFILFGLGWFVVDLYSHVHELRRRMEDK